jgi:hypothetical protein
MIPIGGFSSYLFVSIRISGSHRQSCGMTVARPLSNVQDLMSSSRVSSPYHHTHSMTPRCNSQLCGGPRYRHVGSALLDTPEYSPARVKRRGDLLDITDHTAREHKDADGLD